MPSNTPAVTIPVLQQMKRDGTKIVGVVAWDYQMARIADRAGVDLVSVGDSVGVNLWGHPNPLEVTLDEMLIVCKAVRRGVTRALVSCDFPFGPLQTGTEAAVQAAVRLVKEGGADMVKLIWNSDIIDDVGPKRAKRLIKRAGASKVIFCRCDEEAAVEFGQEIGVNMFQGRFIENLIAEESRRREMEMARQRTQSLDFFDEGGDE